MTGARMRRQEQIARIVRETGHVRVVELSERLRASEATIRRDLDELVAANVVTRSYGGAALMHEQVPEEAVLRRTGVRTAEKKAIARAAAATVHEGDTIFLGGGSTVLHMIPYLTGRKNLTVISNSLPVIDRLNELPDVSTVVVGGSLRRSELSLIGHIAARALEDLRAHTVFMSAEAVHLEHGLTHSCLEETMTDRAILRISPRIVLLVDHSKFGAVRTSFWAPLSAVTALITDAGTDPEIIEQLRLRRIDVTVAAAEITE
jgi:DeoR/GlpR family transcriptional regulator of sugar metabolism